MTYILIVYLILFVWIVYKLLTYEDIDHTDIRLYYGVFDPSFTEREIYTVFQHNTSWKLLVLKVRTFEMVYTFFPILHMFGKYPDNLITMVNKWEK